MHIFQKTRFLMRSNSEKYRNAGLFPANFSSIVRTCSASNSASNFGYNFWQKWLQNGIQKYSGNRYFSRPRFYAFWSPPWLIFGTLGPPSGSLLAPLARFWLTFGTFSLPFGSIWLPFVHFWYIFDEVMKTFINSIHCHEFARLVENIYKSSCFSRHHC